MQVPIVILKTKDMRNSTNIFLTNLSIADLLVLLVCTPTVLVEVNSKPETWVLGHEMCKFYFYHLILEKHFIGSGGDGAAARRHATNMLYIQAHEKRGFFELA